MKTEWPYHIKLLFIHGPSIAVPEVIKNPSSLLVPENTTAVFECVIQNCIPECEVHWYINGTSTAHRHQLDSRKAQGFQFNRSFNESIGIYTTQLSINASRTLNNTRLCCLVQDGINFSSIKSEQAKMLVISGMQY